jgi:hypothetical protein
MWDENKEGESGFAAKTNAVILTLSVAKGKDPCISHQ